MHGLLIVNHFIATGKFHELYGLLRSSAEAEGMTLDVVRSGELPHIPGAVPVPDCDFVLFWDKDVLLARMLEMQDCRLFNCADAVESCDNKAITAVKLQAAGVRTPKTVIAPLTFEGIGYTDTAFACESAEILGYPVIVKELYGSFGAQVYLVHDADELQRIIGRLGHKGFLMQEFIAASCGRDLRVNVVGGRVVSSMLRHNPDDFRSNITNGGKMEKYAADPEQCAVAAAACNALGLDFAGVDLLFAEDGPAVCEVNSNPHFKSTLECTGLDISRDIMRYVREILQ